VSKTVETNKCGYMWTSSSKTSVSGELTTSSRNTYSMQYEQRVCLFLTASEKRVWSVNIDLGLCS